MSSPPAPAPAFTQKGKRKSGRRLIPDESEAENELFSKWLKSEIKKNDAVTEVAKLNKIKLQLEIEKLKKTGLVVSEP